MASIVFGCPPNTACQENPNPFCHFRKEGDTIRKRNKTITVRCTEEEKARIVSKAESYGLPLSDYVLRSAAEKKIVVAEGLSDVLKQQKAIGNNLNQLAMLCNMGRIEAPRLRLYQIPSVNVNTFRNSTSKTIGSYSKLLKTCSIGNVKAEHHIKIEASRRFVSIWDGDNLVIDNYELPENDYGFGYGPITGHASHSCWQQSYFTFSNIKMETVTGYYIKLEQADDEWGLTDEYWTNTFTLETIEYTPEENETIKDFSEHPMFKNTTDMILFYPDNSFEHIPWNSGKADYDNSERYIDLFNSNAQDSSMLDLKPGEKIIGAYAKT